MKRWRNILTTKLKMVVLLGVFAVLIGFTVISGDNRNCESIKVFLKNDVENHFLSEDDIQAILTDQGNMPLIGKPINDINLGMLEERVESNPFVHQAELYKTLNNELQVTVTLKRPIARIMINNGPDAYITTTGEVFPVSSQFVSRVILISGKGTDQMKKAEFWTGDGGEYLNLFNKINEDEFWRAQLAECYINSKGKLEFLPQVSKQLIEFGYPDNIESKFKKLKVFYTQVLPSKGWNTYSRVNLEYKDQIIAE